MFTGAAKPFDFLVFSSFHLLINKYLTVYVILYYTLSVNRQLFDDKLSNVKMCEITIVTYELWC